MRRAIQAVSLAVLAVAFAALPARSQPSPTQRINGIGLVDYGSKPTFKVGDWVRYRTVGSSTAGMSDDYTITVLIAGEEEWWGEDCFWVETWTDHKGRDPETVVSLMSYAIFSDTAAISRLQMYNRKTIGSINSEGKLVEEVNKVAASALKSRTLFKTPVMWDVDTLAADTVDTPAGLFRGPVVLIEQGSSVTKSTGDSTVYTELREKRRIWRALDVPIALLAREDLETTVSRRAWQIGRSGEAAPMRIRERGTGTSRLVAYGHGLEARLFPKERQKSFEQWRAEKAAARKR